MAEPLAPPVDREPGVCPRCRRRWTEPPCGTEHEFLHRVVLAREQEQRDEQERAEWANARRKGDTRRGHKPPKRVLTDTEKYRRKRAAQEIARRAALNRARVSAERAERARNIRRRQSELESSKALEDYLADLQRRHSADDARARAREQVRKLELKQARENAARQRKAARRGTQADRDARMALNLEKMGLGFVLDWKPELG